MATTPSAGNTTLSRPRSYALTTGKFVIAVLVLQGVLFLSSHYRWFWFNQHKGFTVLIAIVATALLLFALGSWALVSRFTKTKTQFSLASLLGLVLAAAIPCGWLVREIELAKRQQATVAYLESRNQTAIRREGDRKIFGLFHYNRFDWPPYNEPPPNGTAKPRPDVGRWLALTFSRDYLEDVSAVTIYRATDEDLKALPPLARLQELYFNYAQVTDAGLASLAAHSELRQLSLVESTITDTGLKHVAGLRNLKELWLDRTKVTDDGMVYLQGLKKLEVLTLDRTPVTDARVRLLRDTMPGCQIYHSHEPAARDK
jgi:hypothetical protein